MESEERTPRWEQTNNQRTQNNERSPGGSVKRARERAAAGFRQSPPPMPESSRSLPTSLHTSPPHRSPRSPSSPHSDPTSPGSSQRSPPPRPPRPNFVPPMFQESPTASNYWEERDSYSGYSDSSRPSTVATGSSTASIPDFPQIPVMPPMPLNPSGQLPPRRNLGPPPTARRGASSYYSQYPSYIPPIAEEQSDKHSSYASSNVIPESWGEAPAPGTALSEYGIHEEDEDQGSEVGRQPSEDSSGRQSKASDYSESSNLVRPARTKPLQPFMDTIESGDESASLSSRDTRGRSEYEWHARQDERSRATPYGRTDGIGRHTFLGAGNLHHPYSGYASDATFLDSPRSGSPTFVKNNYGTPTSKGSPIDPTMRQIMSNLEKGGALTASQPTSAGTSRAPSFHEKTFRRPPPLNLDSANGSPRAPGRSSNSSLPELIRRATRLASNLDRGKTASRAGMLDMLAKRDDIEKHHRLGTGKHSQDGSISDIIAAFPSPSPTASPSFTKPRDWGGASPHGRSGLSRSQTITYDSRPSRHQDQRNGRRCCGMPIWAFLLLVIILLLLVAAAVIIPITLIVVPRQNKSPTTTVESCQKSSPCENKGSSVVLNNQCSCICAGQFTGATCTIAPGADCTTTDIPQANGSSVYTASTVGNAIPRYLGAAQANYSIPLAGWKLAAVFAKTGISCTAENSLVNLNTTTSKTKRSFLPRSLSSILARGLHPSRVLHPDPSPVLIARASALSSNGIVFASGGNPSSSSSAGSDSSAPNAPPPPSGSDASDLVNVTQPIIDFGSTAVLYILQETGDVQIATSAMSLLNSRFSGTDGDSGGGGGKKNATQPKQFDGTAPVTLAGTNTTGIISIDLKALTVGWANGTLVGGRAGQASS